MFTLKRLMNNTPQIVRTRARLCSSKILQISPGEEFDEFKYLVKCTDGYRQVTLRDFSGGMTPQSEVWVSCTCPYFLFTVEWAIAKRTGRPPSADILYCNGRPPVIRNPRYLPYMCKHLYHVTKNLSRDARRIKKPDMRMPKLTPNEKYKLKQEQAKEDRANQQRGASTEPNQLHVDILVLLLQEPTSYRVIEEFTVDSALISEIKDALSVLRQQSMIRKIGQNWEITDKGVDYLSDNL